MNTGTRTLDLWLESSLVCPRDHKTLAAEDAFLVCTGGHRYPLVEGIPVMLVDDVEQTIELAQRTTMAANLSGETHDGFYIDTLGISEDEKVGLRKLIAEKTSLIDPVVTFLVGATNGLAYKSVIGKLQNYPIPKIPVADGQGRTFLDIGCSWGRWSIAAARKGYHVIGIDPSLGAIMAARRVAQHLGVSASFIVGDARYLPLNREVINCAFSYSVLQHFSKQDTTKAVSEIGRVLAPAGIATIQFPTKFGVRCVYQQAKRHFRKPTGFEVRYWSHRELRNLFKKHIGDFGYNIDCFFGIGLQYCDRELYSGLGKKAVKASEFLKARIAVLKTIADSVFVCSVKQSRISGSENV